MIMNLVVIAMVALIAYLWASQGLFSAFLHFCCTVAAGAIAFGVWEVAGSLLLGLGKGVQPFAWMAGLLLPFLVSLIGLRLATDKLIPRNVDLDDVTNFAGGAVFGGLSAVIAVGIFVLSIGFLPLPAQTLGFRAMAYDSQGNLVRTNSLWVPVDNVTVKFYEALSLTGFRTGAPLALRHPDLFEQASVIRATYDDVGRTALTTGDFEIIGRYTVNAADSRALLSDSFLRTPDGQPITQQAKTTTGEAYPAGSHIEGFVVRFNSGAMEKSGQVIVGPGQVRLIAALQDGDAVGLQPFAAVSRAAGDLLIAGRWRFDAPDVFVPSVGGASEAVMAFEFAVPPGATVTDLLVKNVRRGIDGMPAAQEFASPADRDAAVTSMALLQAGGAGGGGGGATAAGAAAGSLDRSGASSAPVVNTSRPGSPVETMSSLGFAFNKSEGTPLEINDERLIVSGTKTFTRSQFRNDIPRQLRVERFFTTSDTEIVQVDVSLESKLSLLGKTAQFAEDAVAPPMLIDNLGQQYQAIGYIFEKDDEVTIRFDPGDPIRSLRQIPTLSRTQTGVRLRLIFRVTKGVEIRDFALGNRVIYENLGVQVRR